MTKKKKKVVAIIPARGGSKEIPRKNIIDICGKPLIEYSINAALGCNAIQEVWVSSDDDEILDISSNLGAQILKRPSHLSGDNEPSESALLHFASNVDFDILVFIQATSPLTTSKDLEGGLKLMEDYDSIVSVTELTQFVWDDSGPKYDLNKRLRRQDNGKSYLETGAFFITSRDGLLFTKNRLNGNIGKYIVPKIRSLDIDSFDDLELVRKVIV